MKKTVKIKNKKNILVSLSLLFMSVFLIISGCSSSTGSSSESSTQLDKIKDKGTIVIATGNYYPFEYTDPETKKLVGYDIDLGHIIAEKFGVDVEWKEMDFTSLIPSVQNGSVDMVIGAMYITPERKEAVGMSDSYMDTGMVLVKQDKDTSIKSTKDLNGKVVGVKAGATSEKAAKDLQKEGLKFEIKSYKDTTDYLADLKNGRIDAAINDYLNQLGYLKQYPDSHLQIVGETFAKAGLGIAVKKDNKELLEETNKIIKDLRDSDEGDKLFNKWLK